MAIGRPHCDVEDAGSCKPIVTLSFWGSGATSGSEVSREPRTFHDPPDPELAPETFFFFHSRARGRAEYTGLPVPLPLGIRSTAYVRDVFFLFLFFCRGAWQNCRTVGTS